MRDKTLIVAVMLLALAFVCFISAPVTFAEDPWDVDGAGGTDTNDSDNDQGEDPPDTTDVLEPLELLPDPGGNPYWLDVVWWHLMRGFALGVSGVYGSANAHAAVVGASGGGSAAR